jgi:N-acyl-D-amino-acid deacylase
MTRQSKHVDLIIRHGTVVDGRGGEPFQADVAIESDLISAVGNLSEWTATQQIDATGLLVTPGFVDIHTHYDGQVIWEDRLMPSSLHGITTVVVGNCGVGFAPCRASDRERLVKLMEGIEDIPGIVMTEGLTWDWESFPEYLDAVESRPHDINIASYLPHSALRVYVMKERAAASEPATTQDIQAMARITRQAMEAGALGFATSRTLFHRSSDGALVPTLDAGEAELRAIAEAMRSYGGGVLQIATDYRDGQDVQGEFELMRRVAQETDRPLMVPTVQMAAHPQDWKTVLQLIENANAGGAQIKAQVLPRGVGMLFGLELSMHPFCLSPTYVAMEKLPLEARLRAMRDPAMRERIIKEKPLDPPVPLMAGIRRYESMFEIEDIPNYEPTFEESISARAQRAGVTPEELVYDILTRGDGHTTLYLPFSNYSDGNLDAVYTMLRHKDSVPALGDGGAHLGLICDASYSTFLLTHWTRDRKSGARLTIPEVIKSLANDTATAVGLQDRGVIAPGYRADLNVIDYNELQMLPPRVSFDLPAGGRRLTQGAKGYVATLVGGKIIYRNGHSTGELPGKLVRGPQLPPVVAQH